MVPWKVILPPEILERFPNGPCENLYNLLASEHPDLLLRLVSEGGLEPCDLTFAAEVLGRTQPDSERARAVLMQLLRHSDAGVREGALLGLSPHRLHPPVPELLQGVVRTDRSKAVRETARQLLEEF